MLRRWRIWAPGIIAIGFLSALWVHAELGTYSRFIADDYCSAGIAKRFGILRAVWYWYLNWTGRYSASALDAVFGLLGPQVTPVVTAVILIVWLAVLIYTAAAYSARYSKQSLVYSLLLAVTLLYLTLTLSPNVPQSLYWGQGMRSVVPPLILSAVYADVLLWFSRKQWQPSGNALWLFLGFLLAFFMGGLNETFAALELSALVFALVLARWAAHTGFDRRAVHFLIAGVVGAGLAMVVVMGAPGNAFRQAFYPPPPDLLGILRISGPSFLNFLAHIFSTPERLMAVAAAVGVSAFLGTQSTPTRRELGRIAFVLAIGLAFAFLCFLPAAYGLSDVPPERTVMIPAHLLAVALMLSGFIAGGQLTSRIGSSAVRASVEAALLIVAAASSAGAVALTTGRLLADRPSYAAYAIHWDTVNAQIIAARDAGKEQILIRSVNNWAGLNEPNDNPKFWVNACYRQYYDIEVLAADQ